jgi:hypothetical protein
VVGAQGGIILGLEQGEVGVDFPNLAIDYFPEFDE